MIVPGVVMARLERRPLNRNRVWQAFTPLVSRCCRLWKSDIGQHSVILRYPPLTYFLESHDSLTMLKNSYCFSTFSWSVVP